MNKYYIKRVVIAKSIVQALKNERKSEITEVYQDYNYIHDKKPIKGFTDTKK